MDYEYISWNRFYRLCGILYERISKSGFSPDLIIAITRGGYPVGRVLSDYFLLMDLVGLRIVHYHGPEKMERATVPHPLPLRVDGRRVLLVDDVSDSGDTFTAALEHIGRHGRPAALRTAVLHHKQTSSHTPDYHAQRVLKWRWITYPWALVEDLTVIGSRLRPAPVDADDFRQRLTRETGIRLPAAVLDQVAPIVCAHLAEIPERVGVEHDSDLYS